MGQRAIGLRLEGKAVNFPGPLQLYSRGMAMGQGAWGPSVIFLWYDHGARNEGGLASGGRPVIFGQAKHPRNMLGVFRPEYDALSLQ